MPKTCLGSCSGHFRKPFEDISGMDFLKSCQPDSSLLEVNFQKLPFQGIKINFLDQSVIGLAVYFQHYLASFAVCLKDSLYSGFFDFERNGFRHLAAVDNARYITFSSKFLGFCCHVSFFSF